MCILCRWSGVGAHNGHEIRKRGRLRIIGRCVCIASNREVNPPASRWPLPPSPPRRVPRTPDRRSSAVPSTRGMKIEVQPAIWMTRSFVGVSASPRDCTRAFVHALGSAARADFFVSSFEAGKRGEKGPPGLIVGLYWNGHRGDFLAGREMESRDTRA